MRLLRSVVAASALAVAALLPTGQAARSPFTSGKLSISTLDGSSRLSETFTPKHGVEPLLGGGNTKLDSDELIRVSFQVSSGAASASDDAADDDDDADARIAAPAQISLQLFNAADPSKIFTWSTPANKANGKVTWSQRVDRLPLHRLGSSGDSRPTYTLRLLLAGGGVSDATSLDLADFVIPHLDITGREGALPMDAVTAERRRRGQEIGFERWEEKRHTFRKEVTEGMPSAKKSTVVAVVLVVVPWVVLLATLTPVATSSLRLFPSTPKIPTSILFASLLFLEVIGVRYYKGDFILFQMLPYFIAGSVVASIAVLSGGVNNVGLLSG